MTPSKPVTDLRAWAEKAGATVSYSSLDGVVQATVRGGEGTAVSGTGKDANEAAGAVLELARQVLS